MALNVFREKLDGKYDAVTPATMMEEGQIAGGRNIRRIFRPPVAGSPGAAARF